jgi:sugar lactone lactonase YvrE
LPLESKGKISSVFEQLSHSQEDNTMKLNTAICLATLALVLSLPATAETPLNSPNGLAFDKHGNLWVANYNSNQVLVYNQALMQIAAISGFSGPTRLAFDTLGNLWVTNSTGNSVQGISINYAARTVRVFSNITTGINRPLGVAVDAYGDVYVANNGANNITAYNVDGNLVETLTQDHNGLAFSAPGALAVGGRDLYVGIGPESGENAVSNYNVGEFLTNDPKELRTPYGSNDAVNTGPTGIAVDSTGNVYVSDAYSGTAVKFAANGTEDFVINAQTGGCEGIALDKNGNIYVSNSSLNTITEYTPTGSGPINTIH